jgi:hypothetical protein
MFLNDNPCQCGDRTCDATWIIEEGLGMRNRVMDVESVRVALAAMAAAAASVLAVIHPAQEDDWFEYVRKAIKETRATLSN